MEAGNMTDNTVLDALEKVIVWVDRGEKTKALDMLSQITTHLYPPEREVVEAAIAWDEQNGDELELTFNLEDAVHNLKEVKREN